jgi:hypothetical protein
MISRKKKERNVNGNEASSSTLVKDIVTLYNIFPPLSASHSSVTAIKLPFVQLTM